MNEFYYMNYWSPEYGYTDLNDLLKDNSNRASKNNNNQSMNNNNIFFDAQEGFVKGNMIKDQYDAYKGYTPSMPPVYSEREKALLEIQKYGFALTDLNLFLNTHPSDGRAMELFNAYRNRYVQLVAEYEEKHGPLSLKATKLDVYWPWNKEPWPWESN